MKKDYELMNELMLSIFCTEAWERIEMHDPQIVKANERHDSVLQKIQNQLHHDDLVELEDAANDYAWAIRDAAVLYGMHVADTLRLLSSDPSEASMAIQNRKVVVA